MQFTQFQRVQRPGYINFRARGPIEVFTEADLRHLMRSGGMPQDPRQRPAVLAVPRAHATKRVLS